MSTYLVINLLIIIVPLIFSFEKQVKFYKKIPAYLLSIIVVSSAFIFWDSIAASRGDWGFNPDHVLGIIIWDLPIEEILFFLTVPYSCLFIYETVSYYIPDAQLKIGLSSLTLLSILFIAGGVLFYQQYYTSTVLFFTSLFIIVCVLFFNQLIKSKTYWLTIAITFIPFFIFNFVLTYIPVVVYSEKSIWGIRVLTIPLEDFFYSYSMISFWILFYSLRTGKLKFNFLFKNR